MVEPTYGQPPYKTRIHIGSSPPPLKCGWTRIVCLGDTLCDNTIKVPEGDLLIHTGNFLRRPALLESYGFVRWVSKQPHEHKIICLGTNEDIAIGDIISHSTECLVLNGTSIKLKGLIITNIMKTDPKPVPIILDIYSDIIVSSVPPFGYLDLDEQGVRHGSKLITEEINDKPPTLCVFGGVASGHGIVRDGDTLFVNAGIYEFHEGSSKAIQFGVPLVIDIKQYSEPGCCGGV